MSVLYGDEGIVHRLRDSGAKALVTDGANRHRIPEGSWRPCLYGGGGGEAGDVDFDAAMERANDRYEPADTAADDRLSSTTRPAPRAWPRAILHAHRYLLAHEEFEFCHDRRDGELFHGSGEWAWAAGIRPLLGPWRYGAVALVQAARAATTPRSTCASSPGTGSRTCSRRPPRCAP